MKTTRKQNLLAAALIGTLAFLSGCTPQHDKSGNSTADTIYTGGHIISINDAALDTAVLTAY